MDIISCVEKEKAEKLINKNILCANSPEGLGNFGVLLGFDDEQKKFKVRMTGGEGTSWKNSIRYYKYIVKD